MPVWLGLVLFLVAWVYPVGPVVMRRTAVSDWGAVVICVLGCFLAIWSHKTLGAEWSRLASFVVGFWIKLTQDALTSTPGRRPAALSSGPSIGVTSLTTRYSAPLTWVYALCYE